MAHGTYFLSLSSVAAERSHSLQAGQGQSVYLASWAPGMFAGPPIRGAVVDSAGCGPMFLVALRIFFIITFLSSLCLGQSPRGHEPEPAPGAPFAPSTPAPLRALWFDFHGTRLCQDIDAVFVFHERGLEIWCLTENLKSLDRLKRMTGSLSSTYRVDLYSTRQQPERVNPDESGPPPGLWNNQELRDYLGGLEKESAGPLTRSVTGFDDALFTLKQRLQMFADQTLELSQRLESYAVDLEELSAVAFDPAFAPADNTRARTLCTTHASGVDECASKLDQNLRRALPSPTRGAKGEDEGRATRSSASPREMATEIARQGRKVAQRVYRFIYPDQFTVGIEDLREPGLLESLAVLRRMTADFQYRLKKS